MRRWKMILLPLLLIALAAPLSAYTIYLKDGTRIVAKEKYRVDEDGKAIITLQNGTQTFIKSSEIDVERTLRSNREGYGTALLLEEGKVIEGPIVSEDQEDDNLVDLAARTDSSTRARPQVRRPVRDESGDCRVTQAGFIDLSSGLLIVRKFEEYNAGFSSSVRRRRRYRPRAREA